MHWHWLSAPQYWLARLVLERALAITYLVAFLVARNQFGALLGEDGLLPVARFVSRVPFSRAPSLFQWRYSDRLLGAVAWAGAVLALSVLFGLPQRGPAWAPMLVWLALWTLYLSIVNVGQTFYGFGWETLLCEAGFLAVFLGPSRSAPLVPVVWLARWLVFRLEFGAGLIKIRGDRCWRDLTCLQYHHETQPMPNPLSWYFHRLPRRLHKVEVVANHVAQLVVPFGLFLPQPVSDVAGAIIVVTQLWLVASGNFSWLNLVTITLAFSAFDNRFLHVFVPVHHGALVASPAWFEIAVLAFAAVIVWLSWRPARNLVSRRQLMNYSFNSLRLVNTYGAFGSITRERYEIVIEATADPNAGPDSEWQEYEFKGKPGDVRRRPPQVAPYHLRLDWLMWFAALSLSGHEHWFGPLLLKLLEADPATLKLLRRAPFGNERPAAVRAVIYLYRFTTWSERRATGAWWHRDYVGIAVRPVRLS